MSERGLRATVVAGIVLVFALSVFDVRQAATIRCVRFGDEREVVMLSDLDPLWDRTDFTIDGPSERAFARGPAALTITGHARDRAHHAPALAVFATVDGRIRVPTDYTAEGSGGSFRVAVARKFLAPGRHVITFQVVPRDLEGYYDVATRIGIDASG